MSENCGCGDTQKVQLIYACSGAANTGFLADNAARKLARDGVGKMQCLAAIGAGLTGYLEAAKSSDRNIVLDGCPVACAKKIFEKERLKFDYFVMTDLGVEKGKTEITPEIIAQTAGKVFSQIQAG